MSKIELYVVAKKVKCLSCGNLGAIQSYGEYYPKGAGELADDIPSYEDVRSKPHMSHSMGFGGTIPHSCMNCGNVGLIDLNGLEGYKQGFTIVGLWESEEVNETHPVVELYQVNEIVKCIQCDSKGSVQPYGKYYPKGVGTLADRHQVYEKYRNKHHMSRMGGFGGTIPSRCLNCENYGLTDFGGLEGYKKGFQTIV